jgi:hypothetical protein
MAGDMSAAAAAESRIMEAEGPVELLALGSRNAAVLGILKAQLFDRGVISSPALTLPLRSMTLDERRTVGEALAGLNSSVVGQ